ncbi:tripartite tricarboxylate transporter TctB family protein [Chloroflexota bacterium]
MKIRGSSYFLMVTMAVMLAMIITSLRMEHFALKLLPLIVGIAVFVLAAIVLCRNISAKDKSRAVAAGGEIAEEEQADKMWRQYLPAGAWTVGFFLAIYLFGFIVAIPLLILSYMKSYGVGWLVSIILTVVIPVLIYVAFELVLRVDLYPGLLFTLLD